jgi:hypothetical protein
VQTKSDSICAQFTQNSVIRAVRLVVHSIFAIFSLLNFEFHLPIRSDSHKPIL